MGYLNLHGAVFPAESDVTSGVRYGYRLSLTGSFEAGSSGGPAVLGGGFIGYYGGYFPLESDVAEGVSYGFNGEFVGTRSAVPRHPRSKRCCVSVVA